MNEKTAKKRNIFLFYFVFLIEKSLINEKIYTNRIKILLFNGVNIVFRGITFDFMSILYINTVRTDMMSIL